MSTRRPLIAPVRFGQDSSDILDLALVAVAMAGAVAALLAGLWWVAVLSAVPSLAADIVRGERPQRLRRLARRILLDRPERSLVRNGAVAIAVAATPPLAEFASIAALLVVVMALHLALTAYTALGMRRLERERATMTWRHLDVAGESAGPGPLPDPIQDRLPVDGLRLLTGSEVLVLGGFALAGAGARAVPWVLAVVVLLIAAGVVGLAFRAWGPSRGHRIRDTDVSVAAAVEALAPEVVFYFSSPASGTYALGVWATVINAMERPVLVVLREAVHLDGVDTILKPTVVAPSVGDLIAVTPSSVRVVLYPTNVVKNNEMIRIAGPMHCFIGHGDSDKVGSFSPLNRMYDEIWVAGRAAIDRYAAVDEGIDLGVLRAVGRPQLADIRRVAPLEAESGRRLTVLYAPTWEGFFDEADYSSVAAMGEQIVRGCLDAGADVLFKPHPLTGHRLPEAAKALQAIDELVRKAGGGSEVVAPSPNSLYEAFNRADLLISDISSVITDFLASRKPYVVTNRRDVPAAEFRAQFPSSSAAELLGADLAALPIALADAAGGDPWRAQREALAEHLLGAEEDPMRAFLDAIDAFVDRAAARIARGGALMMRRTVRLAVTGLLGLGYALLLLAAIVPVPLLFLAAAILVVGLELYLSSRAPYLLPELLNTQLGLRFRVLSLDVLTAMLAARELPDAGGLVALAVVAVLLLAAGRDAAGIFARRVQWRRGGGPVSWRGMTVPGLPVPQPIRPVPELGPAFSLLSLLIPLGYAIGSFTDRFGAAIAAQWIVIGFVLLFLAGRLLQYRVLNRMSNDDVRERVREAIEAAAPQVVLHHSGRRGTVEQVLLWVPALIALDRTCLIVVREPSHLDDLADCGIPVVWAPRSQDVELFMVPSVDLALYPSDSTNINNHLLRVPGIYDVLVGHGDSDEPESRSPIARMYDEVWVAGEAGRERYAYPTSGLPASKVKEIGPIRPRVRLTVEPPAHPIAVYAPSWENVVDTVDLSSVLRRGAAVLDALLARQDVRTIFVPAAPSGSRTPAVATAVDRLRQRVALAGADHATWPASRLPEALAIASFAVVDVSPALAEAVRADVPFAVPAPAGMTAADLADSFPSTTAGAVLRDYPLDVFAALDDALGPDEHAPARLELGRRIDSSGDFTARFRSAVDEAIASQRRRRAFARPTL